MWCQQVFSVDSHGISIAPWRSTHLIESPPESDEPTLLELLDARQDEVLQGLDELHERVLATLASWSPADDERAEVEPTTSEPPTLHECESGEAA